MTARAVATLVGYQRQERPVWIAEAVAKAEIAHARRVRQCEACISESLRQAHESALACDWIRVEHALTAAKAAAHELASEQVYRQAHGEQGDES